MNIETARKIEKDDKSPNVYGHNLPPEDGHDVEGIREEEAKGDEQPEQPELADGSWKQDNPRPPKHEEDTDEVPS